MFCKARPAVLTEERDYIRALCELQNYFVALQSRLSAFPYPNTTPTSRPIKTYGTHTIYAFDCRYTSPA